LPLREQKISCTRNGKTLETMNLRHSKWCKIQVANSKFILRKVVDLGVAGNVFHLVIRNLGTGIASTLTFSSNIW
jgi:hypothetical protein